MKKALIALSILALVASVATAEITFGAWGRTMFVPIANSGADGVDNGAKIVPSWDWGGMDGNGAGTGRIGATIAGKSDNVGFQIDFNADGSAGGNISTGDEQKIWVKPMDMLKITVGRAQDDTLRGNAAFGSFNWYRAYGAGEGEDITFSRLSTGIGANSNSNNRQGVIVTASPTDAFFLAVALRDVNATGSIDNDIFGAGDSAGNKTENLFKNAQIALGYTIEGIGQIRAQSLGHYSLSLDDSINVIEVAFKLTAIENLYADFGFRMNTNADIDVEETKDISAYAKYSMDALTVHGLVMVSMFAEADMEMKIGAGVDYSLADGVGVSADVRYYNDAANDGVDAKTCVFAGVTKGFSNGLIGAGLEIANAAEMGYAIPVRFEYWF